MLRHHAEDPFGSVNRICPTGMLIARASLAFFTLIILSLLTVVVYRLYLHPLSRIPGPQLAAITNSWYAYQVRNGRMLRLGKTLHKQYGPVVRVGPNEVWFNTKDAFRVIYSPTAGYEKSDFYMATALLKPKLDTHLQLQLPDTLDLLAERDMKRYRLQRRLIGPIYHTNNVKRYEHAVDTVMERVVEQLRSLKGTEVELKEWMHIITVECLAAVSLSWSPGYLRDKSDGASGKHAYMGWRRKSIFGLFPLAVMSETLSRSAGRAFSNLWGVKYHTPKEGFKPFFPAVQKKISQRVKASLRDNPPKDDRKDMVADLIQLHKDRPEFNEQYLRRMAITNFGAGHETMTSTLISAFSMIGTHVQIQKRVADEVLQCSDPCSIDNTVRLQFTQASIKEAQRLHPVIGMSMPRRVPEGGMSIDGLYLPPGTSVGCNPVSLHRNPDIFGPDAEAFNPDRWLVNEKVKAMERYNLIWGGGARTCPGRNLAEMLVSKIVPALIRNFEIQAAIPPDNEMPYYFMAMLTGVRARFIPRDHAI
ncbi:Pisatin demethylase [Cytospora mali]|uniref:Pisatin demethylase n=1 Tax=Cytospora mali TaxID=578113 RepID=A0A194V5Q9_CYTMA|nr:Pisatin demethylase [Valsa mali var. pyri (nom. inval.)]